ncbi:AAA domain-containing protein [Paraburkholderia sp. RAU2J]|uniref:ATP-binding protein n=1 Tax=Paraburkholderia sp. RAU2J TaxID=1938810 RepID=UPI000EAF4F8D|nr:ATP-binding protein [Paraburkholderia sp. RAU2J]RKT20509.1 AAA domain-containing protein [Paraburkholderia sp. RAU2J]
MARMTAAERKKAQEELVKQVPLNVVGDPILAHCDVRVKAIYRKSASELPEFAKNWLVLALPAFNRAAILDAMVSGFKVKHPKSSRRLTKSQRMIALGRISRVWVMLPVHIQLLDWLYVALRSRYHGFRSSVEIKRELQASYAEIQRGRFRLLGFPRESHSECLPVFALSGVGKTTAVKMVLSTLPMIIEHDRLPGTSVGIAQAVWVFVSCPHNGSVITLLQGIVHWFDLYLNTRYCDEVASAAGSGVWIQKVIMVLSRHYTGVLIIDEIHNALKAANRTELIDFLTTLFNARCCAFICLGCPEAENQLKNIWTLRRVSSGGELPMTPFQPGELWDRFANALIAIDLQLRPFKDPVAIRATLCDLSAGMPAIAKLVWRLSQYEGIFLEDLDPKDSGFVVGQITPDLMSMAAARGLGLVEGMLTAIKNRDYKKIAELTEMAMDKVSAYLAQSETGVEAQRALDEAEARVLRYAEVADALIDLHIPKIEAEQYARDVTDGDENSSVAQLIRRAIAMYEKSTGKQDSEEAIVAKRTTPVRKSPTLANRSPKAAPAKAARDGRKTSPRHKNAASKK